MHVTLLHNPKAGEGELARDDGWSARWSRSRSRRHLPVHQGKGLEHALEEAGRRGAGGRRRRDREEGRRLSPRPRRSDRPASARHRQQHLQDPQPRRLGGRGDRPARHRRLDSASTPASPKGAWGETHFLEGVGLGAVSGDDVPGANAARQPGGPGRPRRPRPHTRPPVPAARCCAGWSPKAWQIEADGEDLSGEYFLCEAMNIRSVGPNLSLAPEADPADGYLDLVLVSRERTTPAARLHRVARRRVEMPRRLLPTRRVKRVTIMPPAPRCTSTTASSTLTRSPPRWEGSSNLDLAGRRARISRRLTPIALRSSGSAASESPAPVPDDSG